MAKAECPECKKEVTVTRGGIFYVHPKTGPQCPGSKNRAPGREPEPIPGADEYAEKLAEVPREMPRPESSGDWPKSKPSPFSQPSLFSQPAKPTRAPAPEVKPMGEHEQRLVDELKQMFFHYNNRPSDDNRSAQRHLGPSEIGYACDRRLGLSLMGMPKVNPGGDGWAAFVGTCIHEGVAKMLEWADAGTGRYAVEMPLTFPSVHVPKGTGDELDRTLAVFIDQKMMGGYSLNKLRTVGPPIHYRVQVHTYAYGARLRGELVSRVAIVGWPRDKSTLDDLYAWGEPYNPDIAREALARVDQIAERVEHLRETIDTLPDAASLLPFDSSDCKYCPFHMPGALPFKEGGIGCNGRQ